MVHGHQSCMVLSPNMLEIMVTLIQTWSICNLLQSSSKVLFLNATTTWSIEPSSMAISDLQYKDSEPHPWQVLLKTFSNFVGQLLMASLSKYSKLYRQCSELNGISKYLLVNHPLVKLWSHFWVKCPGMCFFRDITRQMQKPAFSINPFLPLQNTKSVYKYIIS